VAVFGVLAFIHWRRKDDYRRLAISAAILAALAALAMIFGYTVAPNIPTPSVPLTARFLSNPTPDTPATVARGKAVYQMNCVVCHGAQGKGDGPAAFTLVPRPVNLQLHVPQHAPGEIYFWITNGIPGTAMPAWGDLDPTTGTPKLPDEDRWALIRYLQALSRGENP
jgi:copper transport protein